MIKLFYHNSKCDCDICFNQKKLLKEILNKLDYYEKNTPHINMYVKEFIKWLREELK